MLLSDTPRVYVYLGQTVKEQFINVGEASERRISQADPMVFISDIGHL